MGSLAAYNLSLYESAKREGAVERAEFKNFHRLLCERFGYAHDEIDWKLDQLSLIEHIANSMLQKGVGHAAVRNIPLDET